MPPPQARRELPSTLLPARLYPFRLHSKAFRLGAPRTPARFLPYRCPRATAEKSHAPTTPCVPVPKHRGKSGGCSRKSLKNSSRIHRRSLVYGRGRGDHPLGNAHTRGSPRPHAILRPQQSAAHPPYGVFLRSLCCYKQAIRCITGFFTKVPRRGQRVEKLLRAIF